jgi:nitrogen regulatory protein PII
MYHKGIKISIVTERFIVKTVCKLLTEMGAKGYTIILAGGLGEHHFHPDDSQATLVEGFNEVKIEVIVRNQELADAIAERLMAEFFSQYSGIVYLEEVRFLRPDRF